jgi:hypothetical protein
MSTHGHRTGHEPEFRWVIGGKRSRLSLVRRLSLSFELRRRDRERGAELWIYAEQSIRRWRISARALGARRGDAGLAGEMSPLPIWLPAEDAPPRWDQGRCVIEAASMGTLQDALDRGPLSFYLQGERVNGDYTLERTPLACNGSAQWVIRREDGAPAEEKS